MRENNPTVSIVIPAFNAENYIDECLQSVVSQIFVDIEIIVVNDASSDSTPDRIMAFAERDGRVRVIDLKQNRGLSGARNAGVEAARGEYVSFLDSDDCLHPEAISLMLNCLEAEGVEICRCAFYRGREFRPKPVGRLKYRVFEVSEALRVTLYQKIQMNPAWAMLLKTDIVRKAGAFREGSLYEDLDSFYRFFEQTDRLVYIENPLYFYRENPTGLLGSWKEKRLDVLDVTDRLLAHFGENAPALLPAAADRRFSAHYNILMLLYKNKIDDQENIRRCLAVIREGRGRALRDPRVRLKNKFGALLSYFGTPMLKILSKTYR